MSKKAKKRSGLKRPPSRGFSLQKSKLIIARSPNAYQAISQVRQKLTPKSYPELVEWLLKNTRFGKVVLGESFPPSLISLEDSPPLPGIGLEKELLWSTAVIGVHSKAINNFLALSKEYQKELLQGKYEECGEILQEIEERFGHSVWLIKNRFSLKQKSEGLESQKAYSQEIKEKSINGGWVSFFSHYISYKNESAVSPGNFAENLENNLFDLKATPLVRSYIFFKLVPFFYNELSNEDASFILRNEERKSIIDHYETLIGILPLLIDKSKGPNRTTSFDILKSISRIIQDKRISIMLLSLGEDLGNLPEILPTNCFDDFIKGNYEEAGKSAFKEIRVNPTNFDALETAVKSSVFMQTKDTIATKENTLLRIAYENMYSLLNKDSEYSNAFLELVKICWNFDCLSWSMSLLGFVLKETKSDPVDFKNISYRTLSRTIPLIHPSRIYSWPEQTARELYLNAIQKTFHPSSLGVKYATLLSNPITEQDSLEGFSPETEDYIRCINKFTYEDYKFAYAIANNNISSQKKHYYNEYVRIVSHIHLLNNDLKASLAFSVDTYLNNKYTVDIIPLKDIHEKLTKDKRKELKTEISLSIFYNIYSLHISDKDNYLRNYSYEDYLLSCNVKKPSELRITEDNIDNRLIVYFLRYICVESVMDSSVFFSNSKEVMRERLAVCQLLLTIDQHEREHYEAEIKDVLRRLTILQRMRQIEESKIYIDIEGIKEISRKDLSEPFKRYISFIKDGISQNDSEVRTEVVNKLEGGDIEGVFELKLPVNEMNSILKTMVLSLRDKFVSSNQHGLNAYISTRIRHGILAGHIRPSLEKYFLITKKDAKGIYLNNLYWAEKLGLNSNKKIDDFSKPCKKFSEQFDKLIQEIISEWIQIRKKPTDQGLFDFALIDFNMTYISSTINIETTFDDFMDQVIDHFFVLLDRNLTSIRKSLETIAKKRANKLLDNLQSNVERLNFVADKTEFIDAINKSRTELQVAFDRVIEWFKLSKSTENEPFSVDDFINISLESLKASGHDIDMDINISEDLEGFYIQDNLPSFVDILFIILENVVRHSKISPKPAAQIFVNLIENNLIIRIENEVLDEIVNDSSLSKLEKIKEKLTGEQYSTFVHTEGGSGFFKIKKILFNDIGFNKKGAYPDLDFGFIDGPKFFVEFNIPFHSLIQIEED